MNYFPLVTEVERSILGLIISEYVFTYIILTPQKEWKKYIVFIFTVLVNITDFLSL